MSYYDDCFEHITDPVQRNSVRQQWLQMVDGGLSVADVRRLLDKYPDFRLAISRWISAKPASIGFHYETMDRLRDFVVILPEFKDVFDKYISELISANDTTGYSESQLRELEPQLSRLATIFPQFKQVAEQRLRTIRQRLSEIHERERKEKRAREASYYW